MKTTDRELLKEASVMLTKCSLIDKSGQAEELYQRIDKHIAENPEQKCNNCGKNTPLICGSCVSDIAQSTAEQAYNSRR